MPRSGLQTDVSEFGICHKVFRSSFNSRAKLCPFLATNRKKNSSWLARVLKRCVANTVLGTDWPLASPTCPYRSL